MRGRVAQWFMAHARWLFAALRTFHPNLRLGRYVLVTRRDDVEEVLSHADCFHVRFGTRLAALHPEAPATPIPGIGTDGPQYPPALETISQVVPFADIPAVTAIVRHFAEASVAGRTRLDAGALAWLTQAELGRRYLGLNLNDGNLSRFGLCCLAIGNYIFGPQTETSAAFQAGRGAAAEISGMLRRSIAHARAAPPSATGPATVLGRLVVAGLDDCIIESTLTGLLAALVPASTLAVINTVQVLLRQPNAMAAARAAAVAGDDVALFRCLFEALRFQPILPGLFRECIADGVIAGGTARQRHVRAGDVVFASTASGMFDPQRVAVPGRFDPDRPAADTMLFGFGRHWCVGFAVGRVQLIETLRPMLRRGFRQPWADRFNITWFGTFPESLMVRLG